MIEIRDGWCSGSLPDDTGREWPVVQHRQESARGPLIDNPPNLVLHTTETSGYVETLRFPSQWQVGEGKIGQHIRLGLAGDAVNEWDRFACQIEIVGRSQVGRWLPDGQSLGPLVALVAWLHETNRIRTGLERPTDWPVVVDQLPAAVPDYYRRKAGLWPSKAGVYGHIEIPQNAHWDPGGFDYPTFFARVRATLEDDMTDEERERLTKLWNYLKALDEVLDPDADINATALGTRVGNGVRKAEEPGTEPGKHDHDDDYVPLGKASLIVKP